MNKIRAFEWKFFGAGLFATAVMAMMLFFGTVTSAADLGLGNNLSVITSKASMRSYQLSQVRNLYMEVYGDHIVRDNKNPIWIPVDNPLAVLDVIQSQTLQYHVTRTGTAYLSVQLVDRFGYGTFFGYKNTEIVTNGVGGVYLKDNTVDLEMNNEVPLRMKLQSYDDYVYQILVKIFDKNGNLKNERQLHINQGNDGYITFYYPTAYLGDILVGKDYTAEIVFRGGNHITGEQITTAYNPVTGEKIIGYDGTVDMSKSTIKDFVFLTDTDVVVKIATTNNIGENKTYQLTLTGTRDLKVCGKTTEGKVAKWVTLRQFDDYGNIIGEENFDNMTTIWDLPAGKYHLWFDWEDGVVVAPGWYDWYYNWEYGGGKG